MKTTAVTIKGRMTADRAASRKMKTGRQSAVWEAIDFIAQLDLGVYGRDVGSCGGYHLTSESWSSFRCCIRLQLPEGGSITGKANAVCAARKGRALAPGSGIFLQVSDSA